MMPLLKTTLVQKRVAIIAYSLGGLALIWMYVAIYPSMASQVGTYNQLLKSMPASIMRAFGADKIGLMNFEGLLGTKQYGFTWPLMLLFLMVSFAGSVVSGEIEKTNIGLWLSQPVSRVKIFWSKYAAGMIALLIFLIFTVLAVLPVAALYKVDVLPADIWRLAAIGGLFGWAVFSLSMFIGSLFSEKSRVYSIVAGILLLMYVANLVAGLNDKLVNLKYVSFFYYYNVSDLLTGGKIMNLSILVFLGIGVIASVFAALIFDRRDIAI